LAPGGGAQSDRKASRRRVLLGGKLVFGVAEFSVDCAIRDLSPSGARVKLPVDLATDEQVWLIDIRGAAAYRAEVAWRKGSEVGLTFSERHDLRAPTPATMTHLRMLWLDCATRLIPSAPESLD
jgi:hypothetical protein